jgi:uncharacterized membrane protein YkvA (DUF1232 family)
MKHKKYISQNLNRGFFQNLILQIRLILRLMADRRVNLLLKILPLGGFIYLLSPIDVFPDIAFPVIGYLDDAFVIWLCITLFVTLCPDEIVKEHMASLIKGLDGTWRDAPPSEETIESIDAEFHEVPKEYH